MAKNIILLKNFITLEGFLHAEYFSFSIIILFQNDAALKMSIMRIHQLSFIFIA